MITKVENNYYFTVINLRLQLLFFGRVVVWKMSGNDWRSKTI